MLGDGFAKLLAFKRIIDHFRNQPFGHAGAHAGNMQAAFVEHRHRHFEALSFTGNAVFYRHPRAVKNHVANMRALLTHLLFRWTYGNTVQPPLDDKGRDPLAAGRVCIRARHNGKKIRRVRIRNVPLGARKHIVIPIAHSFGPNTAGVRPGLRLCQSETGNQIP